MVGRRLCFTVDGRGVEEDAGASLRVGVGFRRPWFKGMVSVLFTACRSLVWYARWSSVHGACVMVLFFLMPWTSTVSALVAGSWVSCFGCGSTVGFTGLLRGELVGVILGVGILLCCMGWGSYAFLHAE
ncbi:hypothetical protein Dimus_018065 [Dionaea muscipula]